MRGELAKEREAYAARIATLTKREEELRGIEGRLNERRAQLETAEKDRASRALSDEDLREIITYMDKLLEALPPEKISEFAASEFYQLYINLLERLGI